MSEPWVETPADANQACLRRPPSQAAKAALNSTSRDFSPRQTLFHFSEDPNISVFAPHCAKGKESEPPRVWAIDEAHAPLYWFPRDCPRAAWWRLPSTTEEDADRWLGMTDAKMVFAVESGWLKRIRNRELFVYRFDSAPFVDIEDHGCHVAYDTVRPLGSPEPVGDLLTCFASCPDVEVRFTPSLWPLEKTLTKSTLHWSFIRMRNAAPPQGVTK